MFRASWLKVALSSLITVSSAVAPAQVSQGKFDIIPTQNVSDNLFINGEFEANNKQGVTDASGIAANQSTSPISGLRSLFIDATGSAQVVKIAMKAVNGKTVALKGGNCQVMFAYTGDATLYKTYVLQGSTKVSAEEVLTNASSVPQSPQSLTWPCIAGTTYDLAIESTGDGAGIRVDSFIGGACFMCSQVSQAKARLHSSRQTSPQTISSANETTLVFNDVSGQVYNFDLFGEMNTSTGVITMKEAGYANLDLSLGFSNTTADEQYIFRVKKGSTSYCSSVGVSPITGFLVAFSCLIPVQVGDQISITVDSAADTSYDFNVGNGSSVSLKLFPSSSQLAVTPNNTLDTLGTVFYVPTATCPQGSIIADGSTISTTYPALAARLGTSTVPDLRGIFVRGAGTRGTAIGGVTYSGTLGTAQGDQMQGHRHGVQDPFYSTTGATSSYQRTTGGGVLLSQILDPITDGTNGTPRTGSETRPANISLTPCISTVSVQAPLLVNSVVSSLAAVTRVEWANVSTCTSTPCTIAAQSGAFSQITRSSTGTYSIVLNSAFGSTAICTGTAANSAAAGVLEPTSGTNNIPLIARRSDTSALIDSAFAIQCVGPK